MADTEFKGELVNASLVVNPLYEKLPYGMQSVPHDEEYELPEQTDNPFVGKQTRGAFALLKGVHEINGRLQVVESMIVGKGNPKTEVLGEDVLENTYTQKIAGIAARLDSQLDEEAERLGKRVERIGWSYERNGSDGEYISLSSEIGRTNENETGKDFTRAFDGWTLTVKKYEVSLEDKAEKVTSVISRSGELDTEKGRTHFRPVHWLFGGEVETRVEKALVTSRPVLSLPTPLRKPVGKIVIGFDQKGKISARSVDAPRRVKRNDKMNREIEVLLPFLSSEPLLASEIAEKAGMSRQQVSKLIKTAISAGMKIQVCQKRTEHREMKPAFFL